MSNASDKTARLEGLISQQELLLKNLKQEIDEIDSQKIIAENTLLKQNVETLKQENQTLEKTKKELSDDLEATKTALFTKMANEKLSVFKRVQSEIDRSYYQNETGIDNKLVEYRKTCLNNIATMRKRIEKMQDESFYDLQSKLLVIENEFNLRCEQIQNQKNQERENLEKANNAWRAKYENEPLTQAEKKAALKQKNIETFIGLNVLSKAGILLFLIGIIALGRFAYTRLPDLFKLLLIYCLGAVLIGVGEYFHKKEKTVFSSALISGGVSVLYAGAATGYFALELFSAEAAFGFCVGFTALAIALSVQLKSQVVCAFATIGGYLPLVVTYMIGFGNAVADKTFLPVSTVYFLLLSVIVLIMTYNKHWYAAQYIGYGFQILALIGVSRCAWSLGRAAGYEYMLPLAVGFAIASFLVYVAISCSKIVTGKEIHTSDSILLGLNTVSGAISVGFNIYNLLQSERSLGYTFLVFAVIYAVLAYVMKDNGKKSEATVAAKIILLIGTLVFSMLVIPLLFGWQFVGIAWSVEGVIIAVISMKKHQYVSAFAGIIAMILSLTFTLQSPNRLVGVVSFAVILLCFWVLAAKGLKVNDNEFMRVFSIIVQIILSVLTVSYVAYLYNYINAITLVLYNSDFNLTAVTALGVVIVAVLINLPWFRNETSVIYGLIFRVATFLGVLIGVNSNYVYNDVYNYLGTSMDNSNVYIAVSALNIILLVAVNILAVFLLASATGRLLNKYDLPVWIYTAVISVSVLLASTTVLIKQFHIAFSNVIISAIYIIIAVALLVVGFKKRYTVVRTGGLVLILAAFVKLCFVDTHALNTGWKIASYFAFGAVLIVISYFYQKFSKKLEVRNKNALTQDGEKTE